MSNKNLRPRQSLQQTPYQNLQFQHYIEVNWTPVDCTKVLFDKGKKYDKVEMFGLKPN